MNTRLGKSFGLAFVVAVGILAVMFALGTLERACKVALWLRQPVEFILLCNPHGSQAVRTVHKHYRKWSSYDQAQKCDGNRP